jgi:hypothetical protein
MLICILKRSLAVLLLISVVSSLGGAPQACAHSAAPPGQEESGHHHGAPAPSPDDDADCRMMLSCSGALSTEAASVPVAAISFVAAHKALATHYIAPVIRHEAPPPKASA